MNATNGVYSSGTGFQADGGFKLDAGSGWMLGAELTYRSITYKKSSANSSLESYKENEIMPMISLGFVF